jgi:hypothetical protein
VLLDFEHAPFPTAAQPNNFFAAGAAQTYSSPGSWSISGGVLLGNPTFLRAFTANNGATAPNLYGTADFADTSFQSTITLNLAPGLEVSAVTGVLFNGQTIKEDYSVSYYSGAALLGVANYSGVLPDTSINGFASFFVHSEAGPITAVTFTTLNAGVNGWDFFLDSIDLQTVPEPSALALAAVGLVALVSSGRRTAGPGKARNGRQAGVVGLLALGVATSRLLAAGPLWVEQGPGPITNGQSEGISYGAVTNPVSGGVSAIVFNPTYYNVLYLGTVNGGVFKTVNANFFGAHYDALTDQQFPALSVSSLAMSPTDTNTLFAGTGSSSNLRRDGHPGFGVGRSTDGGVTWTLTATNTFQGRRINSIVPTAAVDGGTVVLAATISGLFVAPALPDDGGVYRSTDNGTTFTRVSGGSGLPNAGVTSLVPDPVDPNRFYAASPTNGVYRSDDAGKTWAKRDTGITGLGTTTRILLAVSKNTSSVYAMLIANGTLQGMFQSKNLGTNWSDIAVPPLQIFSGAQGNINGAIAADPDNTNLVFIAGDVQNNLGDNGCGDYSAIVYRGDTSAGTVWQSVVCTNAMGTSPHADSRAMVFSVLSSKNVLVYAGDGGISLLVDPNNTLTNRHWIDCNGDLRCTELRSIAYDALSKVVIAGAQDVGTPVQSAQGSLAWNELTSGDGVLVAADADQSAHAGTSIRYSSYPKLASFQRTTWDANNKNTATAAVQLNITNGTYSGKKLTGAGSDPGLAFYTPYVLNAITPSRMLVGTQRIYESLDRGDTLNDLVGDTGSAIGDPVGYQARVNPMTYGSRSNGVAMPDALYVGAGSTIYHRAAPFPAAPTTLPAYPGGYVRGLVMDPQNFRNVFALDAQSRIWGSFDEGASWTELTANLTNYCTDVRCLEIFNPTNSPYYSVLIAGGMGGIFQMRRPGGGGTIWLPLSSGLPHALFLDVHYIYTNNVLVAGSLGRGAWTLTQYFRGGGGLNGPPAPGEIILPVTLGLQQIGNHMVLSWPADIPGYVLESSPELTDPDGWLPVPEPVSTVDGRNTVTVPITTPQQFYRLAQ